MIQTQFHLYRHVIASFFSTEMRIRCSLTPRLSPSFLS